MSEANAQQIQPAPASEPRSIAAIIADLSKPVNPQRLKTKTVPTKNGGNFTADYLPWFQCVRYLDKFAPGWSYEIRSAAAVADNFVMTVRISIPCAEGIVYREASALEPLKGSGYGGLCHQCGIRRPAPRRCQVRALFISLREVRRLTPSRNINPGGRVRKVPTRASQKPGRISMATTGRPTGAKRERGQRATKGTSKKDRPFVDVFADFITATVEYSNHPETPKATKKLMQVLMERVRDQLAEEINAHDAGLL